MRKRIAVLVAAVFLAAVPLSTASAGPMKCIKLTWPNKTVCSAHDFEFQSVGRIARVYKLVEVRGPENERLVHRVFMGFVLTSQVATR